MRGDLNFHSPHYILSQSALVCSSLLILVPTNKVKYTKEATVTTKGLYMGVDKNWDFLGQILQTSVNKILK